MRGSEIMLLIQALDPGASLKFSRYTQQWYVESRIDIGNGVILSGITEHHDTPNDALDVLPAAHEHRAG